MQSKILLVGLTSAEKYQIELALSEQNCVFFTADTIDNTICEKIKNPNMIFVKPSDYSQIPLTSAKIAAAPNTRFATRIFVCEELLSLELEEFASKEDATFFINSPIDAKELKSKIHTILENTGLYEGTLTDKFISQFAILLKTKDITTNAAVSIRSCCDALEIHGQDVVDMTNACTYLCTMAKGVSLFGLIRFYKELNFAADLMKIIDCKPSECLNGAIVYAVLNKELALQGQEKVITPPSKQNNNHYPKSQYLSTFRW